MRLLNHRTTTTLFESINHFVFSMCAARTPIHPSKAPTFFCLLLTFLLKGPVSPSSTPSRILLINCCLIVISHFNHFNVRISPRTYILATKTNKNLLQLNIPSAPSLLFVSTPAIAQAREPLRLQRLPHGSRPRPSPR